MAAAGLIKLIKSPPGFTAIASRMQAKPKLLKLAREAGVEPCDWEQHFKAAPRPASLPNPVVKKTASTRLHHRRITGEAMYVSVLDPTVQEIARQVDEINLYFSTVDMEPAHRHYGFRRVFNLGDKPGFNWNKGGRLISVGPSYQQLPKEKRKEIRFEGEASVEIDIRASHLTILHGRHGLAFDPLGSDPYAVPGIPRSVVKGWVTMTLGYDNFQSRWSSDNIKAYDEEYGRTLGKDFPIRKVREAVLKHLPLLEEWPGGPYSWADLQYLESCIIVDTVHTLAKGYDIPALPVHDSIIVPVSKEGEAREVLTRKFKHHVGAEPALTVG